MKNSPVSALWQTKHGENSKEVILTGQPSHTLPPPFLELGGPYTEFLTLEMVFQVLIRSLGNHKSPPKLGTSLKVQWLRLGIPNAGGMGLSPGGEAPRATGCGQTLNRLKRWRERWVQAG